jgi:hypothetical protein
MQIQCWVFEINLVSNEDIFTEEKTPITNRNKGVRKIFIIPEAPIKGLPI